MKRKKIWTRRCVLSLSIALFATACTSRSNNDMELVLATDKIENNSILANASSRIQPLELENSDVTTKFVGWDNTVWEYEGYIYYITPDGIMKWNKKKCSQTLINETGIGGIIIYETWLYYYSETTMEIRRIRLKDELSQELIFSVDMLNGRETLEQICGFTVYFGKLYINETQQRCFSFDIVSKQLSILNDDVSSGVFHNGKFYYIEHSQRTFTVYSIDLASGMTELVRGDGIPYVPEYLPEHINKGIMCDKLIVVNDKLFYSTRVNPAIYLFNDDKEDLLIDNFSSEEAMFIDMITDGQCLYYTCEGTNLIHMYVPNQDKVEIIEVPDDFKLNNNFVIINNILYYKLKNGTVKKFDIG